MWKNWRNGSVEGLSIVFLAEWLAGDITNLVGCLLTQQVQTQLFTAIYFCVIDSFMVGQHLYYNPPWRKGKGSTTSINAMLLPILVVAAMPVVVSSLYGTNVLGGGGGDGLSAAGGNSPALGGMAHHGRVLLSVDDMAASSLSSASLLATESSDDAHVIGVGGHGHTYNAKWAWATKNGMIGYVCGWISGILYFTSRIPQIKLNFRRKTCDGLNPVMFIMAVLGNLFYGCGVLMESVESVFIINHLPWLLGSVGTLVFDFTIIMQYWAYGTEAEQKDIRKKRNRLNSDRVTAALYEDDADNMDKLPLITPDV